MVSMKGVPVAPEFKHIRLAFPHDAVCVLSLARAPVNVLNLDFWEELLTALSFLEQSLFPARLRALVFASAAKGPIFSAGNDLLELHAPSTSPSRFTKFWMASTTFLSRLYVSPIFTIAAMRGAVPAGGCAISMCCDFRVALDDAKIGLNEVALGLPVPAYWARLFVSLVTPRARAEALLARGEMVSASEAAKLGLVDVVVGPGGPDTVLEEASKAAVKWAAQKDVAGRVSTKLSLRKAFADAWLEFGPEEARQAWASLSDPLRVKGLGAIMQNLWRGGKL